MKFQFEKRINLLSLMLEIGDMLWKVRPSIEIIEKRTNDSLKAKHPKLQVGGNHHADVILMLKK